jgi:hypothetical protein
VTIYEATPVVAGRRLAHETIGAIATSPAKLIRQLWRKFPAAVVEVRRL